MILYTRILSAVQSELLRKIDFVVQKSPRLLLLDFSSIIVIIDMSLGRKCDHDDDHVRDENNSFLARVLKLRSSTVLHLMLQ